MARHFVDTSALVKLYRSEPLSDAVEAVIGAKDTLVLSGIAFLEFQSAFHGLVRQRVISEVHGRQRIALLKLDLGNFEIVPLTQSLVMAAELLVDRFGVGEGLRPADSLQLASALEAHGRAPLDTLLTTAAVLRQCAVASGLVVKP